MASKLVKGTLILSIATLLTRMIGALFWVPFQNIAGDEIVGLYKVSFPLYATLLVIASAGVPLTVSKFVSERLSKGDHLNARRVLKAASIILSITGLVLALSLYLGADFVANVMLHNPTTKASLQVLALAIVFVPLMAVLRGYFQGHQNMMPTGISQVVEQILRVVTVIVLTYYMVEAGFSSEQISAGATAGAFTGAIGGLLVVLWYNLRDKREWRKKVQQQPPTDPEPLWPLIKKILAFSIPISLGSLVYPMIQFLDSATVPRLLQWMGHNLSMANTLYGIYGRGEPFVNLIQSFSVAISLSLVPAISAYVAKKEMAAVSRTISQAWLMTLIVSLPASLMVTVLAKPLNIMMYKDDKGWFPLAILAFAAIFSTVATASTGILQGLGYNKIPVQNLIIGGIVKVIGNFIYIPLIGIAGSALSMVICYLVVCILNMWAVLEKTQTRVKYTQIFIKPTICGVIMSIFLYFAYIGMEHLVDPTGNLRLTYTWMSIVLGLFGGIVFFITLLLTKTLGENEVRLLPMGNRLLHIFRRLHLIRA
ncbi:putative polysaccharide biosynthesis protein [Thermoflavimicrobium dichotomicum]|uniref:Polysaccharide transporter, PST family n=1 Tax=Thermoflavimicrobium dichotomicum TaxID=46223 RepID=A0A1I3STN1_9BACL|nr:polysaccharide biosynthesis protein [Thermoflavimicrobium dichotomicum]SFJ62148.1 polysaccharide transporter, PST family [Thermoflavimicrobium dichotomicum]